MLTTPKGMNIRLIEKMFVNIIIVTIGPSIVSIITKTSVLSKIPKSLENLLMSLPEGVMSKKLEGHLTKLWTISSCNFSLLSSDTKLKRMYFIIRNKKQKNCISPKIPQQNRLSKLKKSYVPFFWLSYYAKNLIQKVLISQAPIKNIIVIGNRYLFIPE